MAPNLTSRRQKNGSIPPPPLRRSPRCPGHAAAEEPRSNLTSKQSIRNPRIRPNSSRRCKRGISTNIDSLPYELLFDILLRLPAKDIHRKARFVCRRWKRVIHGDAFAQAHLHRTGYGLLISSGRQRPPIFIAATHDGGIEVSKLCTKSKSLSKASCNGLVLVSFVNRNYVLYVVNPATKACFKLPKFCGERSMRGYFGIAYAAASMEYKVVAPCYPSPNLYYQKIVHCDVLTVGVDNTWRRVPTHQLSPKANELLDDDPLITEGFMHWASSYFGNAVLTLNVEMEVFTETRAPLAPLEYGIGRDSYHYLSTGRHLSVLITCGDFSWQVWEMEGGRWEWRKVLPDIDLNAHKFEIRQLALEDDVTLRPVGWVKYPEVLLFFPVITSNYDHRTNSYCITYNLDDNEIDSIKLPAPVHCCKAMVHKNSLLCLS